MPKTSEKDTDRPEETTAAPVVKEDSLLVEFVHKNEESLYSFCFYMLPNKEEIDDLVLSIFRDFGESYRRQFKKADFSRDPLEGKISLFKRSWEKIRGTLARNQFPWTVGRDTRQLKGLDEDLMRGLSSVSSRERDMKRVEAQVLERLQRIDPDFRAPIVLHDILKFDDEEVVRILGVRWGVYRHRLHRGRLEFRDSLRARQLSSEVKGATLSLNLNER